MAATADVLSRLSHVMVMASREQGHIKRQMISYVLHWSVEVYYLLLFTSQVEGRNHLPLVCWETDDTPPTPPEYAPSVPGVQSHWHCREDEIQEEDGETESTCKQLTFRWMTLLTQSMAEIPVKIAIFQFSRVPVTWMRYIEVSKRTCTGSALLAATQMPCICDCVFLKVRIYTVILIQFILFFV
ncbi:Hypp5414 [Branchiostoma lanceolatum]|uniref:Hypp5414 protein n=1 Tax=Branchiostoma lanceolatum TaxID=7740 RepID=A0A8K0F1J7_BRALA|nr:Hypp5414 [Branchiostoma lanceolatum]